MASPTPKTDGRAAQRYLLTMVKRASTTADDGQQTVTAATRGFLL